MLNLVDHFGGTLLIFALAMLELAAIFWIYGEHVLAAFIPAGAIICLDRIGLENFCFDLEFMTGRSPTIYWRICWTIVTPIFMLIIFLYSMVNLEPLKYSGWDYPDAVTGNTFKYIFRKYFFGDNIHFFNSYWLDNICPWNFAVPNMWHCGAV